MHGRAASSTETNVTSRSEIILIHNNNNNGIKTLQQFHKTLFQSQVKDVRHSLQTEIILCYNIYI